MLDTLQIDDRPLRGADYKTLALAALGGALEFYDFVIFVFFTPVLAQLFFPPDMPDWLKQVQTFGVFAAGYLIRPVGGIVMAHFGDRVGRKRMFTLSVFLMAIPTLCMGLIPTYATLGILAPILLLALRLLQGAAIGGEIPGAWVFCSEHVPARRIGFACGVLTAGLTAGILMGSLVATGLNRSFSPAEILGGIWRAPFLIGGVFGFIAVVLRQWLHETPVFEAMRRQQTLERRLPIGVVLRGHLPAVIRSILITWMLTAAIVVVILMTPTLMQKLFAVPAAQALSANSLATFTLTLGCVLFGLLADRIGSPRALAVGALLLAPATFALYRGAALHSPMLPLLYAVAGFCVGVVGVVPSLIVRAFPAPIRFTGLSASYNLAYAIFGGLTPPLMALVVRADPMAPAYYVAALCLLGLLVALFADHRPAAMAAA